MLLFKGQQQDSLDCIDIINMINSFIFICKFEPAHFTFTGINVKKMT